MPTLRVTAGVSVLIVLAGIGTGCQQWHRTPITALEASPWRLERHSIVRLTATDGTTVEMFVEDLEFPFIAGIVVGEARWVRVNLNDVRRLEVRKTNVAITVVTVLGSAYLAFATIALSSGYD